MITGMGVPSIHHGGNDLFHITNVFDMVYCTAVHTKTFILLTKPAQTNAYYVLDFDVHITGLKFIKPLQRILY